MTKKQKKTWEQVDGFLAGCGPDEDGLHGSAIYYLPTIDKTLTAMKRVYKITSIENDVPSWVKECNGVRIRFQVK